MSGGAFAWEDGGGPPPGSPIPLGLALALTPCGIARNAPPVRRARRRLLDHIGRVTDRDLRRLLREALAGTLPRLASRLSDEDLRRTTLRRLDRHGLLAEGETAGDRPAALLRFENGRPSPFFAASGSGPFRHHAHPGGLALHTAENLETTLLYAEERLGPEGLTPRMRDTLTAAQILHDIAKTWTCGWEAATGRPRAEGRLAGEGEHHALGLAEAILWGAPAEIVAAQACAHAPPGSPEGLAGVLASFRAALILCGRDPRLAERFLGEGGALGDFALLSGTLVHLGDGGHHLETPAAARLRTALARMGRDRYGLSENDLDGPPFLALWNLACAWETIPGLFSTLTQEGEEALGRRLGRLVAPDREGGTRPRLFAAS